jgi:hypothetical protein
MKVEVKYITKDSIVYSKPKVIKSIPVKEIEIQYLPDTNKVKLAQQYDKLVKLYLAKNIQSDSIKIDTLGYVKIIDTVNKNFVVGRKFIYRFKFPMFTKTITIPEPKHNQLYVGGGLQGGQTQLVNQFNVGLLLKTKSDQIYNVYTGLDTNGQVQVGLQAYWKIKLHK